MENFFGHLKEEYLRHFKQPTFKEAEQLIGEYVYFYNYERIQLKVKTTRKTGGLTWPYKGLLLAAPQGAAFSLRSSLVHRLPSYP